jgi:diacylglycerol kinase (ATP)
MVFRKIMFIVNPAAGNGRTAKVWPKMETRLLSAGLDFQAQYTKGPGEATYLTRNALREGYDCIAAVGGDGTINEVVNGFYHNLIRINKNAIFTAVPTGTGSDFSRVVSFNSKSIASIWSSKTLIKSDLIEATFRNWTGGTEKRLFLNIADLGLGCETALRVNQSSKAFGGFLSFLAAAISAIRNMKSYMLELNVDDIPFFTGNTCMVVVANGKYFGGGMMIAPHADIQDGLLDIVLLGEFTRSELIRNLHRVYQGNHLSHPKVSIYRGRKVKMHFPEEAALEIDGEVVGISDVSFRLIPGFINILSY